MAPATEQTSTRYPAKAFFVIFTEGAERMSFYGLTAILTDHWVQNLHWSEAEAAQGWSRFSTATYLAPLLGGFLADRFLGRFRTILYVSLLYVLGHAVLSASESSTGLLLGLSLIALGAGGIKPNVSVFMGDQFRSDQQKLIERAYGWFYFSINVGSFVGITLVSEVFERKHIGFAFLIPGIAMAVALFIYWLGRNTYTKVPPTGPNPNGFFAVLWHVLTQVKPAPGQSRLEAAKAKYPAEAVDGLRAVYRIAFVFLFLSVFWALFFQYGGSWQLQARKLDRNVFGWNMGPGFVSNFNTLFVLSLIPVMNAIYKRREAAGKALTPLKKMGIGMFISPIAFVAAFGLQYMLDNSGGTPPHALWQGVQYFFLSLAEVLISITGLEFAFTQAPKSMKGVIMGMWFLCISAGAKLSGTVAGWFTEPINWQNYFLVFAAINVAAAVAFVFVARWYKPAHAQLPEAAQAG